MRKLICLFACWMAILSAPAAGAEFILYAYHLKPPYIIDRDKQTGIYYDLARLLGERIDQHTFRVVYLPRRRLEHDLELGRLQGMVIGVNPSWFKDESRTRYLWSPSMLHDEDIVVSRPDAPLAYEGPESLVGKNIGLSLGYYYYGVDELARAGRLTRDDAVNEETSLDKLLRGRVDAAIVTRRTLDYVIGHRPEWQNRFHIARKPHDAFDRMILIPKEYAALAPDVAAVIGPLAHDPEWIRILKKY